MDAEMQVREPNLVSFAGAVWRAEGVRRAADLFYSLLAHPVVSALLVTPLGRRPLYGLV